LSRIDQLKSALVIVLRAVKSVAALGSLRDSSNWAAATETALKDLSELGRLAEYAIVQCATHRAL
jgi:hypothetical protein